MKRILAACVLLLMGSWASGQVNGQGGVYINGVLQTAVSWDYLHAGGISMTDPTTDVAPDPLLLKAANAWPGATSNTTGANTILAGGSGRRIYTVVAYDNGTMAGSTVTININGSATVKTEGVDWTAATSNNATATSLAAAIDAISGVSATTSSAVVRIVPDSGTYFLTITKSAADAGMTATSGTDGVIDLYRLGTGTKNAPTLRFGSALNTGLYGANAGADLTYTYAGVPAWQLYNGTGVIIHSGWQYGFASGDAESAPNVGIGSLGSGILKITNGFAGFGELSLDTNGKVLADAVALSDAVKTAVLDIAIADAEFIGGTLTYTITATDATDHQALTGIVGFSGVRKNGTPDTYHLTIAESASPVLAESAGASTLTDTWEIDAGTNVATISVTANSSLTTPTMTCRYHLILNSANAVTKK